MGETHRISQGNLTQLPPAVNVLIHAVKRGIRHDLQESLRRKVRTGQVFEEQTEKTTKTSHEQ